MKREESHIDMFPNDDLIILSPDSETILEKVELGKVYVIGGIVDETRKNKLTLEVAEKYKLKSVRLPIKEHLERNPDSRNGSLCTILSSNQVFEILLAQFKARFSKFNQNLSGGFWECQGASFRRKTQSYFFSFDDRYFFVS